MRRYTVWVPGLVLAALVGGVVATPTASAGDVGYVEDFALAGDRAAALKQLIPGTEDYYYFHCLNHLNRGELDKVPPLTKTWYEKQGHTQTPRLTEVQTRYALLNYDKDPRGTLEYVRGRLGLRFDHQKEVHGVPPDLPSALDPKRIARATLKADSIVRWGNLQNFEDAALEWVAADPLRWDHRRELLSRLQSPDVPNLPKIVADDLAAQPHNAVFGAYPIHARMTLAQLDELAKLKPDVLNQQAFVTAYLVKLQPGADDDWKRDRSLTRAYLDRLRAFADRLAPAHNSLKAHVLFHRLAFDRADGVYDKATFLASLRLPRNQPYMAGTWSNRVECRRWPADLNAGFATLLPPAGTDEPLVRSYLEHVFATTEATKEFETYVNDRFLRHVLAETKLAVGAADPERWAGMLPPALLQQVKDRVDIDFAFTNRTEFAAGEPVKIELLVKNVPGLLVKVYEINTRHWYRTQGRELDTDVNLDGLVANAERVVPGNADPFRRVPVTLEFPDGKANYPEKDRPGVYVIDFIGAGKSSRTLVRKGRLYPVVTTGTAGQVVRVVDEARKPVNDAHVWVGGHEYKAEKDGAVIVPFSTGPGRHPLVVGRGDFACLDFFHHQPEDFRLTAGIHVDRESLLAQRVAPILVRPGLTLNGKPVSVKLLEDVRLRVTSVDLDGVPSSTEVPNFTLFEDRETVHEVRVPPRLASLSVQVTARVKALSTGKTVDVAAAQSFALNGIARTDKIEDLHLAKFGGDYVLELLGRTGEPKPDRAVTVSLKHREFREPVQVQLKTDAEGRVKLGPLADVAAVTATNPEGTAHTWPLRPDRHTYRQVVHAKKGEPVALPYLGDAGKPSRDESALFEVVGGTFRGDRFDAIAIDKGRIVLNNLPAADYDLFLKRTGEKVRVRVADGPVFDGHVLNPVRHLQLPGLKPVSIDGVTADADTLTVRLRDASKFARVHIFATRYVPEFDPFAGFARVRDAELDGVRPPAAESLFLTGRNIGDEYRYVLERRTQKKYPGNMLERPGFLLNPWAVRTTETGEQLARGGDEFERRGGGVTGGGAMPKPTAKSPSPGWAGQAQGGGAFADLDFLYDAAAVAVNLTADADGVVKLPLKDLGPHALVHVVAVDPLNTTCRAVALTERKALFADLRLRDGLDPGRHFTQQKLVTVAEPGKPFVIADVAGSRFEAYDSLAKVYGLYATLSKNPKLAEFAFVLRWPTLKPEEKRELYSKHACHELNVFLMKKDPDFFAAVVKPYTANKRDKTFLDHYVTGGDLSPFLRPWEHGRLNVVERVLLAGRTPGEPAKTARHLDDLFRLLPPATERDAFLFHAAVEGMALDFSAGVVFGAPKEVNRLAFDPKAEARLGLQAGSAATPLAANGPVPAPPAATAPFGGVGGGGAPGRFGGRGTRPGDKARRDGDVARKLREETARETKDMKAGKDAGGEAEKQQVEALDAMKKALSDEDRFHPVDRLDRRSNMRRLYRQVDPTTEWAENNYDKLPVGQQTADLVSVSPFWTDYAKHDGNGPFLSRHIPAASRSFTEMMLALAVLDLPFEPARHEVKYDGGKMTLTPGGRLIAFHEEVRPADGPGGQLPILVSQNVYRHGDRFREENGEKFDKFVTGEFVVHTVYGCQVVVTNPTSSRQKLSVLVQTPVGSIPLAGQKYTRSVDLDLEPYRTHTADYLFYFPKAGSYSHFPVHVAKHEQFLAAPQPVTFNVVTRPTRLDTGSWDYVSQEGSPADVLAFLNRENVRALNLSKVAFRLRDREFFESVVRLLQSRHLYHPTTYSYGVHHADPSSARQFLLHQDAFVGECGGPIESPLLAVDPVARHTYEHLEYKPLVNARAHALGHRRQVVNDRFHEQYHKFLTLLTYRNALSDADLLAVTYYLLLQDRVDEAADTFARVSRERVPTRMQYDYCAAYLAMFAGKPHLARAVASEYLHHPVDRWRNTFAAVVAQVDEIEGKAGRLVDKDDPAQQQGNLAATEPALELAVAGNEVAVTYANLEAVKLNYYLMDVELLFSTNPFVARGGGRFATIRPNGAAEVALPKGRTRHAVPLPAEFEGRNVLVEATAGGVTRTASHLATTMTVTITENYGQMRVTDAAAGQALPKVYVKVYAKLADGGVKFHKDGYTDLRGRFDYASVNTPEKQAVERFAVLVLSEDRGAVIREAAPPQR